MPPRRPTPDAHTYSAAVGRREGARPHRTDIPGTDTVTVCQSLTERTRDRTSTRPGGHHFTRRLCDTTERSRRCSVHALTLHNNHKRPRTCARHQYSHTIQIRPALSHACLHDGHLRASPPQHTHTYSMSSARTAAVLLRWQREGLLVRSACSPRPSAKSARRATWAGDCLPTRVSTRAG